MKYYNEMSDIDSLLVEFETFNGMLNVVANGSIHSNQDDVVKSLYIIEQNMQNLQKKLCDKFADLWNTIREDSNTPKTSYDFSGIENVTKTWQTDSTGNI